MYKIKLNDIGIYYFEFARSNTLYALQLRKAELEISRLSIENIELRTTIAKLNNKIEKLECDKNERFKDGVKVKRTTHN